MIKRRSKSIKRYSKTRKTRKIRRRSNRKFGKFLNDDDDDDDNYNGREIISEEKTELQNYYYDYFNKIFNNLSNLFDRQLNYILSPLKNTNISPDINDSVMIKLQPKYDKFIGIKNLIKYIADEYKCISEGTWSGKPIVNFYECKRIDLGISTFRFGTNITLKGKNGFNKKIIKNNKMATKYIHDKILNLYEYDKKIESPIFYKLFKLFSTPKKVVCFSLLSPCTKMCPSLMKMATIISKKAEVTSIEPIILNAELKNSNDNCVFISFPLSSNKKKSITLFNFEEFKKTIITNNNILEDDIRYNFYELIKINSPESTFRSIVDVAKEFYINYKDTHILAYHCKSGKDRTSIFDATVQATFSYIKYKSSVYNDNDYDKIRQLTCKFMIFGFLIGYYGTGYFGLKLGANKSLSKYILGENLYKIYFGHAGQAKSSV